MKPEPLIIGIDQSLTNSVLHCKHLTKRWGNKNTKDHMAKRLHAWEDDLYEAVCDAQQLGTSYVVNRPMFAYIEGYAFGDRRVETAGEIGGLLRVTLYTRDIQIVVVPPATLKKFHCGAGNAKKQQVMKELYKNFGMDSKDDNDADARALEIIGYCHQGFDSYNGKKFTKAHRDALKKLVVWGVG